MERITEGIIYIGSPEVAVTLVENVDPILGHRVFVLEGLPDDKVYIMDLNAICTGQRDCPSHRHIHGCFGDNGRCDRPEEHIPFME